MTARIIFEEVVKSIPEVNIILLKDIADAIYVRAFRYNATVWLAGNGGSSATMSHLASDLTNLGIQAICLTDNIPALTAKTNDYGWDDVYTSIVRGRAKNGDILIMASVNGSSGKSPNDEKWSSNLFNLAKYFKSLHCYRYAFIGNDGGNLKSLCDIALTIFTNNPYVVEGVHSVIAHALVSEIKLKRG